MLMLQPLIKYADFSGRARRAEYWQFFAFCVGAGFVLGLMRSASPGLFGMLSGLFQLAIFLPSLAVAVRRFHDINRTGWWVVFPAAVAMAMTLIFVTVVGGSALKALSSPGGYGGLPSDALYEVGRSMAPMLLMIVVPTLAAALLTFVFHVLPGTSGSNRFGDDPKGGSSLEVARVFDAPEDELQGELQPAHRPVFDFGPARGVPAVREASATPPLAPSPQQAWGQPAPTARATFGKRR